MILDSRGKTIKHTLPSKSQINMPPIKTVQSESRYDKYILCANCYEMQKRWSTDISLLTSFYGTVTVKQSDHLIYTNIEVRHYIYPDIADGIKKVNELEVDASSIQLLSIEELMSLINTFKMRICITRHTELFSNKCGD